MVMAGLRKHFGYVDLVAVAHHPPALEPLTVEPGYSPADKVDHGRFLLIRL